MSLKTKKLSKALLKLHPADMLIELGAYSPEIKQVFPEHVYISDKDYSEVRKTVTKLMKKQYGKIYSTKSTKFLSGIEMELLNYGPNESLSDAIKPGYVLVDEEAINIQAKSIFDAKLGKTGS